MSSVAVFWDRDNTLIKDPGYISDPGQVELLPGAAEALKRLAVGGFENIIVTNQSGLARGKFDEAALERIHDRMVALFAEQGARIDAIYFCPYLAGEEAVVDKYRKDSELRKPKPGMILQAALERKIELAGSWMVGDVLHDAQAGRAAVCRTILIRRPGATESVRKGGDVDFVVDSVEQAAATVLKYTRRAGGGVATPAASVSVGTAPPAASLNAGPAPTTSAKRETTPMASARGETAPAASANGGEVEPVADRSLLESGLGQGSPAKRENVEPTMTIEHGEAEPPVPAQREEAASAPAAQHDEATSAPVVRRNEAGSAGDTATILQEILLFLRAVDRRSRADEFALGKLLGAIVQIIALGALTWAVFGYIREEPVGARLGFAILFQLMALTCFSLSPRK